MRACVRAPTITGRTSLATSTTRSWSLFSPSESWCFSSFLMRFRSSSSGVRDCGRYLSAGDELLLCQGERERRRSLSGVVADGSGVVIAREKRVVVIAREKKVVATTGRKKSGRYNGEKKRWSLQRGEKKWFQLFYRRKSTHPQTNKDHKPL